MRYLRAGFVLLLGVLLLTVALANRASVAVSLLPEDMSAFLGIDTTVELPLFLIVFGGIVAGLLIGFVWEWFREHKHRAAAVQHRREAAKLEREVTRLRETKASPEDEILSLLEKPRKVG